MGCELYAFLEVETEYRHWFPRMLKYGFEEGKDYEIAVRQKRRTAQGNETTFTDHVLSMDMTKEISMLIEVRAANKLDNILSKGGRETRRPNKLSRDSLDRESLNYTELNVNVKAVEPILCGLPVTTRGNFVEYVFLHQNIYHKNHEL